MRARKPTCPTCGGETTPPSSTPTSRWQDFLARRDGTWPGWSDPLCETPGVGQRASSSSGRADSRIRVQDLHERLGSSDPAKKSVRVVDTRPASEYGIANLEGSISAWFCVKVRVTGDASFLLTLSSRRHPVSSPLERSFPRADGGGRRPKRRSSSSRSNHLCLPARERFAPRLARPPTLSRRAPPYYCRERGRG